MDGFTAFRNGPSPAGTSPRDDAKPFMNRICPEIDRGRAIVQPAV
jgi:hypothetical protein